MVIFDSYNHTADAARFRVIFPTSQRTSEPYEAVWDNFAPKLRHAGYWVGNKDQTTPGHQVWMIPRSLPPARSMRRISQKTLPIASFGVTSKLLGNCWTPFFGLTTALYNFEHRSSPKTDLSTTREVNQQKVDSAAVEQATKQWQQSREHPGTGNDSFFNYALSLRSAGMSLDQIEKKLTTWCLAEVFS